jgi:MFS transporter, DHA3 family, macrolide efflux protein
LSRDFLLLLQGQFISRLGTQVALTATIFWLKESTGSASLLSMLSAVCAIPPIVLGPFAGAYADRYSRRSILVCCDVICGLASLALALAILTLPLGAALVSIFAVNIVLACGQAFFMPAMIAALPDLLPENRVASGMSLAQALGLVANIAGQALGGLLLVYGPPVLFCLDGLSYLLTAGAESRIRLIHRERISSDQTGVQRFWNDTTGGFRYVWSRPGMRTLFLAAIPLNMLMTPVFVLLPFYTTDVLHQGSAWYGYLMAAFSAGTMSGYIMAAFTRLRPPVLLVCFCAGVLLTSILLGILAWVAKPAIAWALLFGLGLLTGWVSLMAITMLQTATEEGARGRVFGVLLAVSQGMGPVAMLLTGLAAEVSGNNLRLIYTVSGLGSLIIAARLSFNPKIREFFLTGACT